MPEIVELVTGGGRGTCVSCPTPMYHVRVGVFNSVEFDGNEFHSVFLMASPFQCCCVYNFL